MNPVVARDDADLFHCIFVVAQDFLEHNPQLEKSNIYDDQRLDLHNHLHKHDIPLYKLEDFDPPEFPLPTLEQIWWLLCQAPILLRI